MTCKIDGSKKTEYCKKDLLLISNLVKTLKCVMSTAGRGLNIALKVYKVKTFLLNFY